jgi:SAM-dependent methyltransferase
MAWVREKTKYVPYTAHVLELGSRNVNGSPRQVFPEVERYVGIDILPGRDVDAVARSAWLPFADQSFDWIVSTEMLEHDIAFWFTFAAAHRVLRDGGILLVTCRGLGFPFHEWPGDYYRFTPDALNLLCQLYGFVPVEIKSDPQYPGVFCLAKKGG